MMKFSEIKVFPVFLQILALASLVIIIGAMMQAD